MPIQAISDQTPSQFPCGDARRELPGLMFLNVRLFVPHGSSQLGALFTRAVQLETLPSPTTALNTTTDIPPVTERSSIQRHPAPTIAAADQCVCPLYCSSVTHLPIAQIGVSPWSNVPKAQTWPMHHASLMARLQPPESGGTHTFRRAI